MFHCPECNIYRCPICDKSLAHVNDDCFHNVGKYRVYIYPNEIHICAGEAGNFVMTLKNTLSNITEDRLDKLVLLK
jgi:hypothetical protein